jgi:hypothetical protein
MSVTKRISGTYTLSSVNATDQMYINTSTITVSGNLVVLGNTTNINSNSISVGDQYITLVSNLSQSTAPTLNAGLTINRGSSANVWLIWNETVRKWQITNDGSTYGNIITSANAGIANVYADTAPAISANLDLRGRGLWDSVNATGNVLVSIGTVGLGGSGIRVTNTQYTSKELMIKERSIAYSILFG